MSEHFIPLKCLNCGGSLDVYDDMDRFACGFCGTAMIAQRRGGTISLKSVADAIHKVQVGTDKTGGDQHQKEITMKRFLCLMATTVAMLAEPICGKKFETPEGYQVIITCFDWVEQAKWSPVPWDTPRATQILVVDKTGKSTVARVKLGDRILFADMLVSNPQGTRIGGVSFVGVTHQELPVVTTTGQIQ